MAMTIYKRLGLGGIHVLLRVGHNGHRYGMKLMKLTKHRGIEASSPLKTCPNREINLVLALRHITGTRPRTRRNQFLASYRTYIMDI
jgi:hypothetical protein